MCNQQSESRNRQPEVQKYAAEVEANNGSTASRQPEEQKHSPEHGYNATK